MESYRNKDRDVIEERIYVIRLKLMSGSAKGNLYYARISSCIGAEILDFEPEMLLDNYFISDCEFRLVGVNDEVPAACKWILRKSKAVRYNYVEPLYSLGNYIVGIEILHCEVFPEGEQVEENYLRNLLERVMNEDLNLVETEFVLEKNCSTCAACTGIKTEDPRCSRTNRPASGGIYCKHYKPDGDYCEVNNVMICDWLEANNCEIGWKDGIVLFGVKLDKIVWQGTVEQFHLRKDGLNSFSDWKVQGYARKGEGLHILEIIHG